MSSFAVAAALVATVLATSCSSDDADEENAATTSTAPDATPESTATDATEPRPGPVPGAAGDGDGPSVEDQLAAATIPPSPEDCRSAGIDAVTEIIGTEVAFTIGQFDPSGRSLCRYVDASETTLVRVLVTEAEGDPTAADTFAELGADPTAEPIDATTLRVGRLAARFDGSLIEVTVTPDAVADEAAAGDAAVALLGVVGVAG